MKCHSKVKSKLDKIIRFLSRVPEKSNNASWVNVKGLKYRKLKIRIVEGDKNMNIRDRQCSGISSTNTKTCLSLKFFVES